jgi:hypothetical protein
MIRRVNEHGVLLGDGIATCGVRAVRYDLVGALCCFLRSSMKCVGSTFSLFSGCVYYGRPWEF